MADDKDETEPPPPPSPPPEPPPPSDDFGMKIRGGGGWLDKDSSRDPDDE